MKDNVQEIDKIQVKIETIMSIQWFISSLLLLYFVDMYVGIKYKIGFLRYPLLILTCIQFCPLPAESRSLAVWNTVLQVPVMLSKAIIRVESEAQSVPVSLLADLFLFWLYIFGRERILMRN